MEFRPPFTDAATSHRGGTAGRPRRSPSRRRASVVACVLVALATAGCDEALSDVTGPTPNLDATFSSIQSTIFEASDSSGRPACTDCHNTRFAPFNGGLDLSRDLAYANLVGVASRGKSGAVRVIPGDAANSYLIHKLDGRSGIVGLRMPTSGPYLTTGQISVIERWIELGARRD
jgi:hypothetical protein